MYLISVFFLIQIVLTLNSYNKVIKHIQNRLSSDKEGTLENNHKPQKPQNLIAKNKNLMKQTFL